MLKSLAKAILIGSVSIGISANAFSFGDAVNAVNIVSDIAAKKERADRVEADRLAREQAKAERIAREKEEARQRAEAKRIALEKEKAQKLELAKSKGYNSYAELAKAEPHTVAEIEKRKPFRMSFTTSWRTKMYQEILSSDSTSMKNMKAKSNNRVSSQSKRVKVIYKDNTLTIVEDKQLYTVDIDDITSIDKTTKKSGSESRIGDTMSMINLSTVHHVTIRTKQDTTSWQTIYNSGRETINPDRSVVKNSFIMPMLDDINLYNELKAQLVKRNPNIKI